jgi:hypothetical protein
MPDLKKYAPPQIFEVPLRQEQAVLTTCATGGTSISTNNAANKCTSGGCKKSGTTGTANAAAAS